MSAHDSQIADLNAVNPHWTGYPFTLQVNDNANMPETPNGSLVFAYQNLASQNSEGQVSLTWGGRKPLGLDVPALANQPCILTQNWQSSNLSVTNTSSNPNTPIWIEAIGPGLPGVYPMPLPTDGTRIPLDPYHTAQGNALPRYMQLVMTANSGDLTIVAVIGGPTDATGNNAYVIALNAQQDAEPGKVPGYYRMTTQNSCTFEFNWGSSLVFVANLSPETAAGVEVTLRTL